MKPYRQSFMRIGCSEDGSALVVTMLLLVVLTIIGVAATNTSVLEILTSNSNKKKQAAFYAAESGIQHGKKLLGQMIDDHNADPDANAGKTVDSWAFLFDGSSTLADVSDPIYPGEKYLLNNNTFGDHTYTVTVFDNQSTTDGVVFLRSVASGPDGGFSGVEISVSGQYTTEESKKPVHTYTAQQNFGPDKANKGVDLEGIDSGDLAQTQLDQGI
ncbi:pilus assembly PilX N-terminal domain-containing protein [Desulfococcus sp.]|uniref:pilus assembly PilX N-terminal domain-containing protein n=1 Tax=Desulfococcus sp. TaxID=2025834 RepID=UPI003592F0F0